MYKKEIPWAYLRFQQRLLVYLISVPHKIRANVRVLLAIT